MGGAGVDVTGRKQLLDLSPRTYVEQKRGKKREQKAERWASVGALKPLQLLILKLKYRQRGVGGGWGVGGEGLMAEVMVVMVVMVSLPVPQFHYFHRVLTLSKRINSVIPSRFLRTKTLSKNSNLGGKKKKKRAVNGRCRRNVSRAPNGLK